MNNKKSTESKPSTSKKRPRNTEPEPGLDDDVPDSALLSLEESLTFSDTLMALRMMCAQFPHIEKVSVQPFVLRSQLYSSIKDRTQVDREVESLRRERVLRIFKLNSGQDDHAIMFTDDYFNQLGLQVVTGNLIELKDDEVHEKKLLLLLKIERVARRLAEKKQKDLIVFQWFKTHVLQSKLDSSISHQELFSLLSLGGKVNEEHVSQLINAGVLIRQLIDDNMYWFSIPNIGSVLKGLSQGRKELLSFLNRRRHKEMMLALLEKKRLRFSPLDMRFHIRDLIGLGQIKIVQSPSGLIIKIAKD